MSAVLELTGVSAGRSPEPTESGAMLTVAGDDPVTIIVTGGSPDAPATGVALLMDDDPLAVAGAVGEDGAHRWELVGGMRFGTFRASGRIGGQEVQSPELIVTQAAPGEPVPPGEPGSAATGDASGVVEVQVGEYDPRFAQWVGGVFAVLSLAVIVTASFRVLGHLDWSGAQPGAGTFAERSRLAIATLLAVVGGVLLLAGAGLAALEVRGRQRSGRGLAVRTRGAAEVLDKVPAILQRAGLLRATIAVLVTGGLMLLLAVVILVGFQGLVSGPPDGVDPTPAPSATQARGALADPASRLLSPARRAA